MPRLLLRKRTAIKLNISYYSPSPTRQVVQGKKWRVFVATDREKKRGDDRKEQSVSTRKGIDRGKQEDGKNNGARKKERNNSTEERCKGKSSDYFESYFLDFSDRTTVALCSRSFLSSRAGRGPHTTQGDVL